MPDLMSLAIQHVEASQKSRETQIQIDEILADRIVEVLSHGDWSHNPVGKRWRLHPEDPESRQAWDKLREEVLSVVEGWDVQIFVDSPRTQCWTLDAFFEEGDDGLSIDFDTSNVISTVISTGETIFVLDCPASGTKKTLPVRVNLREWILAHFEEESQKLEKNAEHFEQRASDLRRQAQQLRGWAEKEG